MTRRLLLAIGAITALAFLFRLALLVLLAEAPGDGPTRAAMGYHWYLTGQVSFYAHWLQGHQVMIGLLLRLIPEPALAGRLLSLAAGTAAVPLLAWVTFHALGARPAALAALALALSPMHAALSATSLSEAVALAALLGMMLATFRLADAPGRPEGWALVGLAALAGTSVRFEVWLAIPVLTLYFLVRTRSLWRTALLGLVMLPFPLLWLKARFAIGGLAAAYRSTLAGAATIGAEPVALAEAVASVLATLGALAGGPLLWLAAAGLLAMALLVRERGMRPELAAYLAILALETLFLVKFATDIGQALWPRYLAIQLALLLPAVGFAIMACLRPPLVRNTIAVAALAAMVLTAADGGVNLHLVRRVPQDAQMAARWLGERPPEESFLLTRMSWQSSYLPVLARLAPDRYQIVSNWVPDEGLAYFARSRRPAVVVTREGDTDLLERVCRVTGLRPRFDTPLARFGRVAVLQLDDGCDPPPKAG